VTPKRSEATVATAFDAGSLERGYAFLDGCPEDLLHEVITLPSGSLADRVAGVKAWRETLLQGSVPAQGAWPPPSIAGPVRAALQELGLVRFCKGQQDLVDTLMKDIVRAFATQARLLQMEVSERLRELERLERERLTKEEAEKAALAERKAAPVRVPGDALRRFREQAEREVSSRDRGAYAGLTEAWGERTRAWAEIADVFGDLGEMLGRGWDLTQGVLRHTGWLEVMRLRKLIEQLPQMRDVVRALGRLHTSDGEDSVGERIMGAVRRLEEERMDVRSPLIPAETRGVERSGAIARMLPVEALMLGHPQLRMLWHARRAENALLTYRVEGVETERIWVEREDQVPLEGKRVRLDRGPIVAVMDTSGSMHGLPEQVAKALVLEALRTAHSEQRRCLLFAYSGPGQVLEHELDLTPEGIGRLLEFLGLSFGGGNDEVGVLSQVLDRLKAEAWTRADVVFVSDGEWPAPTGVVGRVKEAKGTGTRFHGVQIGNLGRTGLHAVCDPVHEFSDWAAAGGWSAR